jgi:thiosulfate dehydrogenase [quinone] large subunit
MSLSDSARVQQTRPSQADQSQPTVIADARPAEGAPGRTEAMLGRYALAVARLGLGFIFLWAFLDKLFGLDHSTPAERSWLNGASPTAGYLASIKGPFAGFFNSMSGAAWADWLFMLGLLGIGGALMLGIGMRIAAATGSLLLVLMWMASLPITTNPFMDEHLIYAAVIIGAALLHLGDTLGFGGMWGRLDLVKRFPVLR